MKRHEALPGKYLAKEDFEPPRVVTITHVRSETIKTDRGEDVKPICYFEGGERGFVLNVTNWEEIERITDQPDSDDWKGARIEVYCDPTIKFGRETKGGIRVRAASSGSGAPSSPDDLAADVPF
jgi:hypothetical protein